MAGNIVFLSSIELKQSRLNKLERYVYKYYEDRISDIIVEHNANAHTLSHHLNSPDTEMLFWVSHSTSSQQMGIGISSSNAIIDKDGNDLKNLFAVVHPNIKFLGIIGCEAREIVTNFIENGNYTRNPGLRIYSFEKRTMIFRGTKKALKAGLKDEENERISVVESQEVPSDLMSIRLTREAAGTDSLVRIGDKGYFFGEDQSELNILMSVEAFLGFSSQNISHKVIESKEKTRSDYLLPIIKIDSPDYRWKIFSNSQGKPLGTFRHLYLFDV